MHKNKKCTTCGRVKSLLEFNKNKSKKDGLNSICRKCSNLRSRQYYRENHNKHLAVVKERKRRNIQENREKLVEYLKNNPCVDCKETDILVLQFDHQRDKIKDISKAIQANWSWQSILDEINKCQVRCANCHTRRTARQFSWWKV